MYLQNKDLYYEIIVSKAQGFLTRKAEKMIHLLGTNVIRKLSFYKEEDREDALQTSMMVLYSNWYLFSEDKSTNIFAYLTEICKRSFARNLKVLYDKKGDKSGTLKVYSIEGSNDGMGLHSI